MLIFLTFQIAEDQNQLAHFHIRVTGGLVDPLGDGEQDQLSGREAQIMRCRWGKRYFQIVIYVIFEERMFY
jgi:hypothetical protein